MNTLQEFEKRTKSSCKNNWEIKEFLQELINKNIVRAYDVKINKSIVEKDTDTEKVVRTIKGASLTPITDIHPNSGGGSYFFQNVDNQMFYAVEMKMRISDFDFEDLKTKYGHLNVTRLSEKAEFNDIGEIFSRFNISENVISGRFHYRWDDELRGGEITGKHIREGYLKMKGESDDFFSRLEKFLLQ
ncbi:hypothetical protein ES703_97591 [subsurface metagenome]